MDAAQERRKVLKATADAKKKNKPTTPKKGAAVDRDVRRSPRLSAKKRKQMSAAADDDAKSANDASVDDESDDKSEPRAKRTRVGTPTRSGRSPARMRTPPTASPSKKKRQLFADDSSE